MEPLLNPKQVAQLINCKPSSVYSWAKLGQIPALKINGLLRFARKEIEAWIEKSRLSAVQDVPKAVTKRIRKAPKAKNLEIDRLIKTAIDSSKGDGVTSLSGNQAQIEVLREEAEA